MTRTISKARPVSEGHISGSFEPHHLVRLLGSSALSGGTLRGLGLALGIAAGVTLGAGSTSAQNYTAGGGNATNAPTGNATAVGFGAQTTGANASAFGN